MNLLLAQGETRIPVCKRIHNEIFTKEIALTKRPDFLWELTDSDINQKYRFLKVDRSGERIGWLLVLVLVVTDAVLFSRLGSVTLPALIFTALFLLAAAAISFSNWLERNTGISTSESSLVFQTPLRAVEMAWGDVDSLMLTRRGTGWYVMVASVESSFTFQTPLHLKGPFGKEEKTGIENGKRLAAVIAKKADLLKLELEGDVWVCRRKSTEKTE